MRTSAVVTASLVTAMCSHMIPPVHSLLCCCAFVAVSLSRLYLVPAAAAAALQAITRKTRILDVNYNASNNELVSSTQQQEQQQRQCVAAALKTLSKQQQLRARRRQQARAGTSRDIMASQHQRQQQHGSCQQQRWGC
jgi:hypothetical protein